MKRLVQLHKRILEKPKPVRGQYALWTAVGITSVFALVWAVSLPTKFASISESARNQKEVAGNISRVFTDIRQNAASVTGQLSAPSSDKDEDPSSVDTTSLEAPAQLSEDDPNMLDFGTFFNGNQEDSGHNIVNDEDYWFNEDEWEDDSVPETTSTQTHSSQPRTVLISTSTSANSERVDEESP